MGLELGVGGTYPSTLDEKWRLGIPIKLRDRYQGPLIITLGVQTCARIMRRETWDRMNEKIIGPDDLTETDRELVELQYLAPMMETEVDKAGRIAVPPIIRRYAELKKDCMILNLKDRLEVWDEELLLAQLRKNQEAAKEVLLRRGWR